MCSGTCPRKFLSPAASEKLNAMRQLKCKNMDECNFFWHGTQHALATCRPLFPAPLWLSVLESYDRLYRGFKGAGHEGKAEPGAEPRVR